MSAPVSASLLFVVNCAILHHFDCYSPLLIYHNGEASIRISKLGESFFPSCPVYPLIQFKCKKTFVHDIVQFVLFVCVHLSLYKYTRDMGFTGFRRTQNWYSIKIEQFYNYPNYNAELVCHEGTIFGTGGFSC